MAFNINDLTQYFDNPAVSKFNRSRKVSTDIRIGQMLPMNWEFLNFGNSIKGTSFHSMRLAPLLAPNFSDLQIQEHTAAVPLRVIMQNYEDTFNYATNKDGAILPSFSAEEYHNILLSMCVNGLNPIGSLFDYMGFPVYADLFDSMSNLSVHFDEDVNKVGFTLYGADIVLGNYLAWYNNNRNIEFNFTFRDSEYSSTFSSTTQSRFLSLVEFVASQLFSSSSEIIRQKVYDMYVLAMNRGLITDYLNDPLSFSALLELSPYETVSSLMNAYQSFIFGCMLRSYILNVSIPEDAPRYSSLPLRAYWRFHADWNVNGNFFDRESFINNTVFALEVSLNRAATGNVSTLSRSTFERLLYPAKRLWSNDFWTSQLPTSAVDNAIEIPANSTVLNLASLTAFQKLVMKLSYSSRYRDVIWNVFKIAPSDARLQQSSVISRRYHSVGIGETLQTSESTTSSVLGNFAGRGYSSGKSDYYHILAEEPMIIINLFSLIPFASYADALHPNIHLDDIFDIPIPDMDVLGNQPIMTDLLSGNVTDSTTVFGFGRQYQEFLANYDTVHGQLKTTLSYWQLSRRFGTAPALNDSFLRISDRDDFDNLFSVPESPHAFATVLYKYHVTRHVHRNVRILI